ncbi:MAG: DUF805 domain-containing protein [Gammaproteobacteria bacterium]|nr:MAG: DUF805 domain-containing protein [Gammaproteobacteria bacterium]
MSNEPELNPPLISDPQFAEIKFFSPNSRINRLRYWAHSMLMTIPFYIALGLSAFLAIQVSLFFWGIAAIAYVAMIVFGFVVIIQRLHDLDKSGWLSLLILVPVANIVLLVLLVFFKGTEGSNKYGLPPPPNKTWHWILGLGVPIIFALLGILAALFVAIPAYDAYGLGTQQEDIQSFDAQNDAESDLLQEAPAEEDVMGEESADDEESLEEDDVIDDAQEEITAESEEVPDPDTIK